MRDFLQEYTIRFYFEWSWIDDIDTTAKILRFRRLPQRSENQYSSWHDLSWFGLFIRDYWLRKDWPHCRLQLKWLYSERSFFFSSCNQPYNNCKSLLLLRLGDYVVHCVTRSLRSVKETPSTSALRTHLHVRLLQSQTEKPSHKPSSNKCLGFILSQVLSEFSSSEKVHGLSKFYFYFVDITSTVNRKWKRKSCTI